MVVSCGGKVEVDLKEDRRSGYGWVAEKNEEDAATTEGMDPEGDLVSGASGGGATGQGGGFLGFAKMN